MARVMRAVCFAVAATLCGGLLGGGGLWGTPDAHAAEEGELSDRLERESERNKAPSDWCAAELETLPHEVCYAKGPASPAGKRTLVVFLHGLTKVGSGWQYNPQKGLMRAGKRLGFSLLAPRGRVGLGDKADKDETIAWPTSNRTVEDEVVSEWMEAKALIEKREGAPFDEVFVLGFSNGAYFASSLALRGRLDVDGYGIFAGGSAGKGTVASSKNVKNRRPVFLAIASKDETTAKKAKELRKALKELKWPHESMSKPVGHTIADEQLDKSIPYLRSQKADGKSEGSPDADKKKTEDKKKTDKKKAVADKPQDGDKAAKKKKKKKADAKGGKSK